MVELGLRPIAHQQQQQQPDATAAAPASTATAGTSGSPVHGGRGSVAAVPELHEAALRELEEENRRAKQQTHQLVLALSTVSCELETKAMICVVVCMCFDAQVVAV